MMMIFYIKINESSCPYPSRYWKSYRTIRILHSSLPLLSHIIFCNYTLNFMFLKKCYNVFISTQKHTHSQEVLNSGPKSLPHSYKGESVIWVNTHWCWAYSNNNNNNHQTLIPKFRGWLWISNTLVRLGYMYSFLSFSFIQRYNLYNLFN